MIRSLAACAVPLALLLAAPAGAEGRLDITTVNACVATSTELGTSPNGCVDQAHAPCLQVDSETPAVATLCFEETRADWSAAISARMATLSATAPERLAALAGIELKYDLLTALVQCDRMEELAQLREIAAEDTLLQKTRCAATASGLAYVRLLWRLPDPETAPQSPPAQEKDQ
ncbi:hypothetical protein [Maliponia aquimaris]|uniref:Lysozyme inhibitor LprI N-terminal domain-containing protein n=1 Tax=Maliponia aquimaris TaxID=1673631 RepID=A0A238KFP8_9RHOB|nr:hypothetical protein [Maliponia aquimaris]SMX41665.1 hypothetical protein MAA8898_02434 [Maliponia aquimaris]